MPDEISHEQQGQEERARRIRKQIARLKSGEPVKKDREKPKSLREQIEERSEEEKKRGK